MLKNKLTTVLLTLGLSVSAVAGTNFTANAESGASPLSGLPGGEENPDFAEYKRKTSVFIPLPPTVS